MTEKKLTTADKKIQTALNSVERMLIFIRHAHVDDAQRAAENLESIYHEFCTMDEAADAAGITDVLSDIIDAAKAAASAKEYSRNAKN